MRAGTIFTGNDIPGRLSIFLIRRGEDSEVSAIACELICGDLAITDGARFATQLLNWRAMFGGRTLKVDNSDPRARFQGRREIIEKGIGLGDLVIHVHEDSGIQRGGGQAWVVRFAQR